MVLSERVMLVRLQFVVRIYGADGDSECTSSSGTALAWPLEGKYGLLALTHEPLDSIAYGSEAVAIADLDRWLEKFPDIIEAEYVVLGSGDPS
jgi:hypothetical protein